MGAVRTVLGAMVLVGFVSALAVRPLLSNPAISTALGDGLFTWETLLALPVVLIVLALVGYRVRSLLDGEADSEHDWEVSPAETSSGRHSFGDATDQADSRDSGGKTQSSTGTSYLTGQGGTRNKEFELEEEPPETALHHHFEHLQAELGDEESVSDELDRMAELLDEVDDDRRLPDRCPYEYCDTPWTEPTLLRDPSGNFEVLDDGKTVLCLNCEQTVTLEREIDE